MVPADGDDDLLAGKIPGRAVDPDGFFLMVSGNEQLINWTRYPYLGHAGAVHLGHFHFHGPVCAFQVKGMIGSQPICVLVQGRTDQQHGVVADLHRIIPDGVPVVVFLEIKNPEIPWSSRSSSNPLWLPGPVIGDLPFVLVNEAAQIFDHQPVTPYFVFM